MMAEEDKAIVRQYFAASDAQDEVAVNALLAPDVVVHYPRRARPAELRGADARLNNLACCSSWAPCLCRSQAEVSVACCRWHAGKSFAFAIAGLDLTGSRSKN